MSATQIEGLSSFTNPEGYVNKGRLPLPENFDTRRFVGKWTKKGPSVQIAKQPERIPSEKMEATGWQIWSDPKTKQICSRTLSTGVFILMFRPRVLQTAINKLYGNASRRRMVQEAEGKTVAGQIKTDSGIFTQDVLSKIPGLSREGDPFETAVPFNDLTPTAVEEPVQAVATTQIKNRIQTIESEE